MVNASEVYTKIKVNPYERIQPMSTASNVTPSAEQVNKGNTPVKMQSGGGTPTPKTSTPLPEVNNLQGVVMAKNLKPGETYKSKKWDASRVTGTSGIRTVVAGRPDIKQEEAEQIRQLSRQGRISIENTNTGYNVYATKETPVNQEQTQNNKPKDLAELSEPIINKPYYDYYNTLTPTQKLEQAREELSTLKTMHELEQANPGITKTLEEKQLLAAYKASSKEIPVSLGQTILYTAFNIKPTGKEPIFTRVTNLIEGNLPSGEELRGFGKTKIGKFFYDIPLNQAPALRLTRDILFNPAYVESGIRKQAIDVTTYFIPGYGETKFTSDIGATAMQGKYGEAVLLGSIPFVAKGVVSGVKNDVVKSAYKSVKEKLELRSLNKKFEGKLSTQVSSSEVGGTSSFPVEFRGMEVKGYTGYGMEKPGYGRLSGYNFQYGEEVTIPKSELYNADYYSFKGRVEKGGTPYNLENLPAKQGETGVVRDFTNIEVNVPKKTAESLFRTEQIQRLNPNLQVFNERYVKVEGTFTPMQFSRETNLATTGTKTKFKPKGLLEQSKPISNFKAKQVIEKNSFKYRTEPGDYLQNINKEISKEGTFDVLFNRKKDILKAIRRTQIEVSNPYFDYPYKSRDFGTNLENFYSKVQAENNLIRYTQDNKVLVERQTLRNLEQQNQKNLTKRDIYLRTKKNELMRFGKTNKVSGDLTKVNVGDFLKRVEVNEQLKDFQVKQIKGNTRDLTRLEKKVIKGRIFKIDRILKKPVEVPGVEVKSSGGSKQVIVQVLEQPKTETVLKKKIVQTPQYLQSNQVTQTIYPEYTYTKTNIQSEPKLSTSKAYTSTIPEVKYAEAKLESKNTQAFFVGLKQNITKNLTKSRFKEETKTTPRYAEAIKSASQSITSTTQIQKLKQEPITRTNQRYDYYQEQVQKYKTSFKVPETKIPVIKIGKEKLVTNKEEEKNKEYMEGFVAFIKRKGKFLAVSPITSQASALDIGASIAKSTLDAQFKIEKVQGKQVKLETSGEFQRYRNEFRDYKIQSGNKIPLSNTYIQLEKYRLGTKSEVNAIQKARKEYKL